VRRLTDGERDTLAELERDAYDMADATTEVELAEIEESYRRVCEEAADQQHQTEGE
jgi:hypothetical protein